MAGQAWECEPRVTLAQYHRAKTGSLFVACTEAGALAKKLALGEGLTQVFLVVALVLMVWQPGN